MSYKSQELLTHLKYLSSVQVVGSVSVAHLFSFLCCVVFFSFVCLGPVSYVPNVASISGMSVLDCSFSFL